MEWRRDKKSISGRIIFNRNMDKGLFKVMLAGDVSTGKTSFLTQLIYQTAERNPVSTQTLSFFALKLTNPDANLQLWDSPGDPRHHYQVVSSLAPFQALLIFVDITNTHTQDCAITLLECTPSIFRGSMLPISSSSHRAGKTRTDQERPPQEEGTRSRTADDGFKSRRVPVQLLSR